MRLIDPNDAQVIEPGPHSNADDDAALPDFLSEDGDDEESDRSEDDDALTIAAE